MGMLLGGVVMRVVIEMALLRDWKKRKASQRAQTI
jgi:hypothetical protein